MNKKQVIVIVGPTGIGKTSLAQNLAGRLDTQIIHADSRQVYRYMDVGTAKPDMAAQNAVKHHLIDVVAPDECFSAGMYRTMALRAIEDIINMRRIPIIEGGTGLYIRALLEGLFSAPAADRDYRDHLMELSAQKEGDYLYNELEQIDPKTAERLHPNDQIRIIRALEVYHLTGHPISVLHKRCLPEPKYDFRLFGLNCKRELLYERINKRVLKMMENGLLDEVRKLLDMGYNKGHISMQGLGYRHMLDYLDGVYQLDMAVSLLQRDTRRYAKRQLTWFRKNPDIRWFDFSNSGKGDKIADKMLEDAIIT